jgi:hypothetical protein
LGHLTPQKSHPAVPAVQEAEVARNYLDVDMHPQLLFKAAGCDRLRDVPLPHITIPDVPLPDVSLHNVPLPHVLFPEAGPDCSVGKELTNPLVGEEEMVVAFGQWSGPCLVGFPCSYQFITVIDYYMHHEVFESLKVYWFFGFCFGFISLVVLYSYCYETSHMQCFCNSLRIWNLIVMEWELNKFDERIVNVPTSLRRTISNCHLFQQCIPPSMLAVDNAREDLFQLPQIFMLKEVHLRQLVT